MLKSCTKKNCRKNKKKNPRVYPEMPKSDPTLSLERSKQINFSGWVVFKKLSAF